MNDTEYSGKLTARLPKELHKKLVEEAKEQGVSLNTYIIYVLAARHGLADIEKGDKKKIKE